MGDGFDFEAAFGNFAFRGGACVRQQAQNTMRFPVRLTFVAGSAKKPLSRVQRTHFIGVRWPRRWNQERSQH